MTITEALKRARSDITKDNRTGPPEASPMYDLRNRRVRYALSLLGVDTDGIDLVCQGSMETLVKYYYGMKVWEGKEDV